MSAWAIHAFVECGFFLVFLTLLALPLGAYMARVYGGTARWAQRVAGPLERMLYRVCLIDPAEDMSWGKYALSLLGFSAVGLVASFAIQAVQAYLPLNPDHLGNVDVLVALNTAVSFVTNTNWQVYGGETTMSYLTQMLALTTQNFVSAAAGMAVLVALARGFTRRTADGVGNFWFDLTRSVLYVLVPLSIVLAIALVACGVTQTLHGNTHGFAVGPAASQVAIKQLGTNGGGFFNVNSAHPFENPTPLSNFLECLAILLVPAALCFTFGAMVGGKRHGVVLYAAMLAIFIPLVGVCVVAEHQGNPALATIGVDVSAGNLEGKETRFGVIDSALWAVATTAASNGSVNSMHDSFTPIGGLVPMWLMQLGEVIFGGTGSGLYGLLMYAIIAVFIAGLMVGRTPEYLGKKIEAFEMKMASLVILIPAAMVLVLTAIACATNAGTAPLGNPGVHGFSEILYAMSSASNNNGSAFGGLTASGPFYALTTALAMLVGRFLVILPVLAMAGNLARKKIIPASSGTLPTDGVLFVVLVAGTILLVGALTFIPALALGPIVEHLMWSAP
ncbi:MAG: potassium-transporting ATPase subunit KdpA [Clostridia bacterium]|nr:potassium-transporting ATPase subunit KdpA [Deltaproteobacteria bacterium]